MSVFDRHEIELAVRRLSKSVRRAYPPHIFEPTRIEIACELVVKEYYKLFPFMTSQQMRTLPATVLGWLSGDGYTLDPVIDFWNYIDGTLSTLKLKVLIVPYITSAHVTWRLEHIDPRQLSLYAPLGRLGQLGPSPYTYEFIKKHVLEDLEQFQFHRADSDYYATDTKLSRDAFPILALREKDGSLQLLDGNRRCLRAFLYERTSIKAWVGTVINTPAMHDYWVNTGFICRLLATYQYTPNADTTAIRTQLHELLASSSIARLHFEERCSKHFPFAKQLLDVK